MALTMRPYLRQLVPYAVKIILYEVILVSCVIGYVVVMDKIYPGFSTLIFKWLHFIFNRGVENPVRELYPIMVILFLVRAIFLLTETCPSTFRPNVLTITAFIIQPCHCELCVRWNPTGLTEYYLQF